MTTSEELATWLDLLEAEASARATAFEVRAEMSASRAASLEGGDLRMFQESHLEGLCVRIWQGGAAGFASCHDPSRESIRDVVDRALKLARRNAERKAPGFPYRPGEGKDIRYAPAFEEDPGQADPATIATLLERVEAGGLAAEPEGFIRSSFGTTTRTVSYRDADGTRADIRFSLSTLMAQAVHRGARLAEGVDLAAGERGLTDFEHDGGPEAIGRNAVERAKESSSARAVPVGRQRVLCDPMLSGLLAHESFGHLTEFDLVSMGWSILADHRHERFAPEEVSIIDSPTVPGAPMDGIHVPYDDEGTKGEAVRILDQGVLSNWLHSRGSVESEEAAPTGNGRALSLRYPPLVRMRNTFFEAGDWSLEEALEDLGDGVYLIEGRGGAPASDGSFMFTAVRGYLVQGGEIQEPLRSTTISGNILDFLSGVRGVTRDFKVSTTNFGGCGKWGQAYIPVGMGGPHVLVEEALVGGEAGR